jgi:polyisoprenoid-binding protein YceI
MKRLTAFLLTAAVLTATPVLATEVATEVPAGSQRWVAHPDKSSLVFTATQEGAEFAGRFHKFSVSLETHPTADGVALLAISSIIQLGSVDTQYQDRDDTLIQEDWFNVAVWPEARFSSTTITATGNGRFVADGELSLRDVRQAVPVILELTIEDNGERGTLRGTAQLNRLEFGVGQGDWASTEWVGDVVEVEFDLYILRAYE